MIRPTTPAAIIRMTQRANDLKWQAFTTGSARCAWLAEQLQARVRVLAQRVQP